MRENSLTRFVKIALLAGSALGTSSERAAAEPFSFRDGDRVVLVGSTLIEREQRYGYWETALTIRNPDKNIVFRNLGWSGDTVFGEARAGFDTTADGFRRLEEHVLALKPTVIFLGYGTNESFAGETGLPGFVKGYNVLLDSLAPAKAKIVLLSPLRHEDLGHPLPDPAAHNREIRRYRDAIRTLTKERGCRLIDLFEPIGENFKAGRPDLLTDNGIHLTGHGYWKTAMWLEEGLGWPASSLRMETKQVEQLRAAIIEKNLLYFHRWRPQNETYLFGFRKYEQGQNAKEIPQFDPLVAQKEAEIARLKGLIAHQYEIGSEK